MPRKQKTIKIDGKTVEVYELTVKQIIEFKDFFTEKKDSNEVEVIFDAIQSKVHLMTSLAYEQFLDLTPSDIKTLYEAFKEVNVVFFEILSKVGLFDLITQAGEQIKQQTLSSMSASSLSQDI